jgi:chromosomal replication initiator protein
LRILDALEKKINRHSYDTWLKPTRYSHSSNGIMYVRVPTNEFRSVGDKYADLISEALDNLNMDYQDVQFVTPDDDPAATPVRHDGGLTAAPAPAMPSHPISQSRFDWDGAAQLNARYTFDAFVIGSGNQFAHAACQAVSQRPSKAYNPLFLYGGVGMGKTHLMQAIGHEIKRMMPQSAICYVSSEKFTNEMINSLRYDKMTSFRDKFRNMDVLLIDDIQFLAQKERTQEEFFHTFNALHESMKQIVIASDRPPKELAEFEDRLRSRFEWGLIADIQPPDIETRVAILEKKAEFEGIELPQEVAIFLATNIDSNVRELEGSLTRLGAFASLNKCPITVDFAREVLQSVLRDRGDRAVTIESIQKAVCDFFRIRPNDLRSKKRTRTVALPRQIAMYLCRLHTHASFPVIGERFGGRDHSTVIHAAQVIERRLREDPGFRATVERIERLLERSS